LLLTVIATLVIQLANPTSALANPDSGPDWKAAVKKIPSTRYERDARTYIRERVNALKPYVKERVRKEKLDPVLADLDTRYFDGARFRSVKDAGEALENLRCLVSYLESYLEHGHGHDDDRSTAARAAHVSALVGVLSAIRQLADAAMQDADATLGPYLRGPPPTPAPPRLDEAKKDLAKARKEFQHLDKELTRPARRKRSNTPPMPGSTGSTSSFASTSPTPATTTRTASPTSSSCGSARAHSSWTPTATGSPTAPKSWI
jgi:hypothetical protein